jgi:hypothetical protein
MNLVAIAGLAPEGKARLSLHLARHWAGRTESCLIVDNNDQALDVAARQLAAYKRLAGGCVCCSLAGQLIPLVGGLQAQHLIMPVSMQAEPEALRMLLDQLGLPYRLVAYVEPQHSDRAAYLLGRLQHFADLSLKPGEDWNAALRL